MLGRSAEDLVVEREFLLASIQDLEAEHATGTLGEEDYSELRNRYVRRAAEVLRAIEAAGVEPPEHNGERRPRRPGRVRARLATRRARRFLLIGATICFAAVVAILAASMAGVRLPGQTPTGSVSLSVAQTVRTELTQAAVLSSEGQVTEALALYGKVLAVAPEQPEALAYRGWLVRLTGLAGHDAQLVRTGDASLARAVVVAPRYADARALDGVALLEDGGHLAAALVQFRAFIADGAPGTLLKALGPEMAAAFGRAGDTVPKVLRPYAT